jgi:biopolymer transport protein ExbB
MMSLLIQGGWVMYPLLGFSVIALTIILERGLYYLMTRQGFDAFLKTLEAPQTVSLREQLEERQSGGYLSQMARAYGESLDERDAAWEEKLFIAGSLIIRAHERRLAALASIAQLSPLLGLFGTVLGMIEVFRKLETLGGRADVTLLSGGIWVALLTTAFGLLVAVPSLIAHHYFSGLVTERSENLQLLVSRLNVLSGRKT